MAAIRENQVVIIAGETGSGKTTQIPKMCLDLGRGRKGLIGHTQPRRLAARTVAERIAEELDQEIGQSIGYAIRFDDRVQRHTAVKLMTDGILLAEMQRDRLLEAYDTIIIDEAHERSLNIDFLLGYLKRLLPRRKDLKVIITSATIDPERFAEHFAAADGTPAPIVEVSGRTYPVEIRYRPLTEIRETKKGPKEYDIDPFDGLVSALEELMKEGPGDILCFFAGEREIRDAMEVIDGKKWRGVEVVPLFGRLSNQEQHQVFRPHSSRRIVLATNIAETSLTVPGIRYVVDLGQARISRYSHRTKIQRLPIEPISQASANQRSGRCGRVADGVAIRLYSEEDFLARPEFTDPEILRTNLASVILQMAALRLGEIADFPFVQAPDRRSIRDGMALLHELGAIQPHDNERPGSPRLTAIGKALATMPVDPRMARMLFEAHTLGCLPDVTVIVAALSIQDVREHPLEQRAQSDQMHARFKDPSSDFMSYLKLWDYLAQQRGSLSGNGLRKLMKKEFLHFMRYREWQDLIRQLRQVTAQLGWNDKSTQELSVSPRRGDEPQERNRVAIHQSLLAGLLSHIGVRKEDSKEYSGARGTSFVIFPGSPLSKKPPQCVMANEIVETSRLFARDVAAIDPAWVERAAKSLLKYQYSEPHWSSQRECAMVYQKATLYGVTVVADRLVSYAKVDPAAAREMFIRHALVDGDFSGHWDFFKDNQRKLEAVQELEEKARRRDIVIDEEDLVDFYRSRIPENVTNGASFNNWWKKTSRSRPGFLDFDESRLSSGAADVTEQAFPDAWRQGSLEYELEYLFQPGHPRDGITVRIPVPLVAGIRPEGFDWLVPGMRQELFTELIRTLPKAVRRTVVPAPDFASAALSRVSPRVAPVVEELARVLEQMGVRGIDAGDFRPAALPAHLRVTFAAVDRHGEIIDADADLLALQERLDAVSRASMKKVARRSRNPAGNAAGKGRKAKPGRGAAAPAQQAKAASFAEIGQLPESISTTVDGQEVTAYPALVVHDDGLSVETFATAQQADAAQLTATLKLLMREISLSTTSMVKGLVLRQRVAVDNYPHGGAEGFVDDARVAAIRDLMIAAGGAVRSAAEFDQLLEQVKKDTPGRVRRTVVELAPGIAAIDDVRRELGNWQGPAIEDMRAQIDFLLPPLAITHHGVLRLRHLPRYAAAMRQRLEDMGRNPDRDAEGQEAIEGLQAQLRQRLEKLPKGREKTTEVKDIYWMLQELRVSIFAQRLGTAYTVSPQRVMKKIQKLR